MKLVNNPKGVWKHYSTQALGLIALIQGMVPILQVNFGLDTLFGLPLSQIGNGVSGIVAIFGLVGKYIDQSPLDTPPSA